MYLVVQVALRSVDHLELFNFGLYEIYSYTSVSKHNSCIVHQSTRAPYDHNAFLSGLISSHIGRSCPEFYVFYATDLKSSIQGYCYVDKLSNFAFIQAFLIQVPLCWADFLSSEQARSIL